VEGESTKTFTIAVSSEDLERAYEQALKSMAQDLALPGFRKGHVPKDIATRELGEQRVLAEAANNFLKSALASKFLKSSGPIGAVASRFKNQLFILLFLSAFWLWLYHEDMVQWQ